MHEVIAAKPLDRRMAADMMEAIYGGWFADPSSGFRRMSADRIFGAMEGSSRVVQEMHEKDTIWRDCKCQVRCLTLHASCQGMCGA